ncbi:hypothetical protein FU659_06770 [Paenibacillus sp. N3.4]|nr:hypothetical protein FU659_06770 [Paenibacillus sp. N3.4]
MSVLIDDDSTVCYHGAFAAVLAVDVPAIHLDVLAILLDALAILLDALAIHPVGHATVHHEHDLPAMDHHTNPGSTVEGNRADQDNKQDDDAYADVDADADNKD